MEVRGGSVTRPTRAEEALHKKQLSDFAFFILHFKTLFNNLKIRNHLRYFRGKKLQKKVKDEREILGKFLYVVLYILWWFNVLRE